jgi:uncharacterized protein YpbB
MKRVVSNVIRGIELLLLHMARKMNGQRSLAGSYHILTGKKSGQAIQDAALFGFNHWFGLFPEWKRSSFDKIVSDLFLSGKIKSQGDTYIIQPLAEKRLSTELNQYLFLKRAHLLRNKAISTMEVQEFWKRFQLLSQVISHYLQKDSHYNPIVSDIETQNWVREFWLTLVSKESFIQKFKTDVCSALSHIQDDLLIHLILDSLSGHRLTGRTFDQLSQTYKIPTAILRLYFTQGIGLLYISFKENQFYSLNSIFDKMNHTTFHLTYSTQVTYNLIVRGNSLDEISKLRKLKRNTIEDHVIEMSIHLPTFDISQFISEEKIDRVVQVSQTLGTKKIGRIKESLPEEFSFFDIRLALIKGMKSDA